MNGIRLMMQYFIIQIILYCSTCILLSVAKNIFELDIDFAILQGFVYYNKLNIIGYESNPVKYNVERKQEFSVTLMLENIN